MRFHQRGYLYLTTGANGTGKTLFSLKDVRELELKEGCKRQVYYTERFEALQPIKDFGWLPIKAEDWVKVTEPAIFLMDEAHKDFPLRSAGSKVPEHVLELAEHRKRGHDFFFNTHLPQKLDVEVRRLIGAPGWHRHFLVKGPGVVFQDKYNFANPNADKPGQSQHGERVPRVYPKDVYTWYRSAEVHTAKGKIPRAVYKIAALALLVGALALYAVHNLGGKDKEFSSMVKGKAAESSGAGGPQGGRKPMTAHEYVTARTGRLEGLPWTAPAYDAVTQPTQAPYPAACVQGRMPGYEGATKCKCWSQQATVLDVPESVCQQIARNGFFVDWAQPRAAEERRDAPRAVLAAAGGGSEPVEPVPNAPHPEPVVQRAVPRSEPPPVSSAPAHKPVPPGRVR